MNENGASLGPLELVSYCMSAQALGVSQREALRVARKWGVRIRTETFRDLWQTSDEARTLFGLPGVERR